MRRNRSKQLMRRARRVIPGGVNSPVRAYGAVGGTPPFIARGRGARVWDADGNAYLDYVGSWGALALGHADRRVLAAVRAAAGRGTSFGAPTQLEVELAELVCGALPSVEQVRFVSSGTEAAMSALRLARAVASSSSRAAITAIPTRSWWVPGAASRRSASRARRACRPRSRS